MQFIYIDSHLYHFFGFESLSLRHLKSFLITAVVAVFFMLFLELSFMEFHLPVLIVLSVFRCEYFFAIFNYRII